MTVTLVFLAALGAVAAWWLSHQRLGAKPWLEQGVIGELDAAGPPPVATAKVGLGMFLAVVGSLFALFISAYVIRMQLQDWWALPLPKVLWLNTAILAASSVALHWCQRAARRDDADAVKTGLVLGGGSALAFLLGQLFAWRELNDAGYFLAANPANSFFYLLTGVHGLHMLGGLIALGRTSAKAWRGAAPDQLRLSVELCAMYWHFLFAVWVVVFVLIAGWAGDFLDICRQLLS